MRTLTLFFSSLNSIFKKALSSLLILFSLLSFLSPSLAQNTVDPNLSSYQKTGELSGKLNSIGSDTLNNLMTYWAEAFQKIHPAVQIQIEGKGSSTAPPALIAGTAQLGPMSRAMKATEIDAFEKKFGYKPTEIKVGIDALAIYVHKDNPITGLTLTQLDGAFSTTRKRGGGEIKTWGDLGLKGAWQSKPVSLYGRNAASGTYGFFKEVILQQGDFKNTVKEQPGSSAVVQGVATDLSGLGYSGIGYNTSGVKVIPIGLTPEQVYAPSLENSLNRKYPMARFLYIYVNKKPGQPLDPLTGEFIKFIQSKAGQQVVLKDGYYPLPSAIIVQEQKRLETKTP